MSILKVQAVRSDGIYRKIMEAPVSKKMTFITMKVFGFHSMNGHAARRTKG